MLSPLRFTLAPSYANAAEMVHIVGKGQTLGRIAKRYHVTVDAIREVNGLRAGERIHPGLSLVIPEKGKPEQAGAPATPPRRRAPTSAGRSSSGQGAGGRQGATRSRSKPGGERQARDLPRPGAGEASSA